MEIELKYRITEMIDRKGKTRMGKAALRKNIVQELSTPDKKFWPETLSTWENYRLDSKSKVSMENLLHIAAVLDCSIKDLVNTKSEMYSQLSMLAA